MAAGTIPLRAVKPLAQLAAFHPGLAAAAAAQVLDPSGGYESYTWAEVERAPLQVAITRGALPADVFRSHTPYPIALFP